MAVAFKLKRSSVSGRAPDTGSIDYGELAINTFDGVLYLKKNDGNGDTVIPIQQVTEYNLAVDNSSITNSTSNNLSGVLRDLDSAINQNKGIEIGADDSTLRTVGPGESVSFLGGNNIATVSDAEGNITIALNTVFTLPTTDGTNGQALVTDGNGTVSWQTITSGVGSSDVQSLYDLDNVNIDTDTLAEGDVLQWNGTNWVAGTATVGGTLDGGDADQEYSAGGITTGGSGTSSDDDHVLWNLALG